MTPRSIHDLEPLEAGGPIARQGFAFQDHVAAQFCLHMTKDPDLSEVWSETIDDIVLIWGSPPNQIVEFIQVKANDPNQYWTMAKVTELDGQVRPATNGTRQRQGEVRQGAPNCILEKSLAHDRCQESVRFRIVTWVPIHNALRLLTWSLAHADRNDGVPAFEQLCNAVPDRVRSFRSQNGNDFRFWLKNTLWQVVSRVDDLRLVNEVSLQSALEQDEYYLLRGQREEIYLRMLAMVKEAGDAPFEPEPNKKKIVREQLIAWIRDRADEATHPRFSGKNTLLREKMERANLPNDMVKAAIESRHRYLRAIRQPEYLDLSDRDALEGAVAGQLLNLRSELYSGARPNDGPNFHNACLRALEQIQLIHGAGGDIPSYLLQGCMYEMASRCAHRFDGAV